MHLSIPQPQSLKTIVLNHLLKLSSSITCLFSWWKSSNIKFRKKSWSFNVQRVTSIVFLGKRERVTSIVSVILNWKRHLNTKDKSQHNGKTRFWYVNSNVDELESNQMKHLVYFELRVTLNPNKIIHLPISNAT